MPETSQAIDWPGIRANAVSMGISAAARAAAAELPPDEQERFRERVAKRAVREKWEIQRKAAELQPKQQGPVMPMSKNVQIGQKAAIEMLERRKESSRLSMSRYAQRTMARAATLPRGKLLAEAANVKAAAGVFAIAHPEPVAAGSAPTITLNVGFLLDCQQPAQIQQADAREPE